MPDPNVSVNFDWENLLTDLPEVSASTDLIPPDTYTVTVEKAEAGLSKTGNSKIELTFKVTEGPHENRRVWGRVNFAQNSKDSMAITVSQLAEFGISRQWLATHNPNTAQIAGKMVGAVITLKVGHREYEGKTYYDVRNYKRAEGAGGTSGVAAMTGGSGGSSGNLGASIDAGSALPF